MNIQKMMREAQKVRSKMASIQEELGRREVEASVGGGAVTVKATCAGEIVSIKISPAAVDPEDITMLEDLVLAGVREALVQGKRIQSEELGKVTAGLGLPPGLGF